MVKLRLDHAGDESDHFICRDCRDTFPDDSIDGRCEDCDAIRKERLEELAVRDYFGYYS